MEGLSLSSIAPFGDNRFTDNAQQSIFAFSRNA